MIKKIAPIIITVIGFVILGSYLSTIVYVAIISKNFVLAMVCSFMILGIIGLMLGLIYNLRERFREIKEEDKDDLSKY